MSSFGTEPVLEFMITDMAVVARRAPGVDEYGCFVRLFGRTADGKSVCAYLAGFQPYVYVECPCDWDEERIERDFLDHIDRQCRDTVPYFRTNLAGFSFETRCNVYGYTDGDTRLLKLRFSSAAARRTFCTLLAGETQTQRFHDAETERDDERVVHHSTGHRDAMRGDGSEFWLYDQCVEPLQQFINDSGIMPSRWVRIRRCVPYTAGARPRSHCAIDIDANWRAVECDAQRQDIAPLVIESFDIECVRRPDDGQFPRAEQDDPIVQIGSTVAHFGDAPGTYRRQVVHCLGETVAPAEARCEIRCYETESALLHGYLRYLTEEVDPDIRLAYNSQGFDHPYIHCRLQRLTGKQRFGYGRVRGEDSQVHTVFTASRGNGGRTRHLLRAPGRVDLDLMRHARVEWRVFRGGLDGLAKLKQLAHTKIDLLPAAMRAHWLSGDKARRGLVAHYCAVDTELPLDIVSKCHVVIDAIEMSRLCAVPLHDVWNRGVSHRVGSMLLREVRLAGYVVPERPLQQRLLRDDAMRECIFEGGVQGATVLEPTAGLHDAPIATLDFASLYPSIACGYNLCWTRLVLDPARFRCNSDRSPPLLQTIQQRVEHPKVPGRACTLRWVPPASNERRPLLYRVLTTLIDERRRAKRQMAEATERGDAFATQLYNGKQLALKIVCNSMYGYCNTPHVPLYCPAIAAAITHHGRRLIAETKRYVERQGYTVIAGDTDSVFVDFGRGRDAFEWSFGEARRLAADCSALFPLEIVLEFEKVYWPFVAWGKKAYCGVKYIKADSPGTVSYTGLFKDDKIGLLQRLTRQIVACLLERRVTDVPALVERALNGLVRLSRQSNETMVAAGDDGGGDCTDDDTSVTLADLVICQRLQQEPEHYKSSSAAHVKVALALALEQPGEAPRANDTVEYVWACDRTASVDWPGRQIEKKPLAPCQFKRLSSQYRLHVPHYVELVRKTLERLLSLPGVDQTATMRIVDRVAIAERARATGFATLASFGCSTASTAAAAAAVATKRKCDHDSECTTSDHKRPRISSRNSATIQQYQSTLLSYLTGRTTVVARQK